MARPSKTTPEKADTVQVTFRIPSEWIKRAEVLAKRFSEDGVVLGRTDGFRLAIKAGFERLKA